MTFDEKMREIRRLLTEAYAHYFEHSDGHCKSSEGAITVYYPPFFWREGGEPSIGIYSYVLGPDRDHYFKDANEALAAVIGWHAAEMCEEYEEWA
jgi:hypothetical protein